MTELDEQLFRALHGAFSGAAWVAVMAALTVVGGGWGSLSLVPLFASARTRRFAASLAGVLVTTSILVFALKRLFGRVRPCACLEGVSARVFDAPHDYSFPSGHAAGSFAFAVFVSLVVAQSAALRPVTRSVVVGAMLVLAAGVALSRVVLGVHYPADVAAGAMLGACAGAVGARLHLASRAALPSSAAAER